MDKQQQHTAGPWRWEFNAEHRSVHLVGGVPQFDLTIMDFTRWGMSGAGICLREPGPERFNLMHKLHERTDWIAPFPGRAHHKNWCANVVHPDMALMAAAPDLLAALQALVENGGIGPESMFDDARAAIAKATGTTEQVAA